MVYDLGWAFALWRLNRAKLSYEGLTSTKRHREHHLPTADFSVIDPYRMMRTDGSAEKSTQPIVHAWCVRVNINATRCKKLASPVRLCFYQLLQEGVKSR